MKMHCTGIIGVKAMDAVQDRVAHAISTKIKIVFDTLPLAEFSFDKELYQQKQQEPEFYVGFPARYGGEFNGRYKDEVEVLINDKVRVIPYIVEYEVRYSKNGQFDCGRLTIYVGL